MRITGTLLRVEPYAGTFTGDNGKEIPYSGLRLHVFDGLDLVKVKVPKDQLLTHGHTVGDVVDLSVTVVANAGARGAYLTMTLVGSFDPSVTGTESLAPKTPARLSSAS